MDIIGIDLFDQNVSVWHVLKLDSAVHGYYLVLNLFDQNVGMAYAEVRLRCSLLGIDLFDQNVGMAYAEVILRCLLILLVLIYFIKIWMWHVLGLGSDIHRYYWY